MTTTVTRASFFKAIAVQANLEILYQSIPADKDNAAWIQFNAGQSVTKGDVLAALTQSTYGWTNAQMDALFDLAATYDGQFSANPIQKLDLYNIALRHLGERKLVSLSEAREARRYLDDEYQRTINLCLRGGLWNFAMRAIQIDSDSALQPSFGYRYAFPKPFDWMRTSLLSSNETFQPPMRDYQDQDGYWLCNADTLYARYVSSEFGYNLSVWPADFVEYVGVSLARTIAPRVTQNDNLLASIEQREAKYRKRAQANDAMDQPPTPWPLGTWTTNRVRRGVLPGLSSNIKYW